MISKLAQKITNKFFPGIEPEKAELCTYFFFILFSKWLSFAEVLLSGVILRNTWNAIVFFLVFTPLREYSGGIHAKKEIICVFCTALALSLSTAGIKLLEITVGCVIQAVLLIVGTSAIFLFSPLDTPEKPLDEDERIVFGRKSKYLSIAADLFAVLSYMLGLNGIMNAISMGLALEGILLIAGKIQSKSHFKFRTN